MFNVHRIGPASLSIVPRPRGGDWLEDEIRALHERGVQRLVSLLTAPEQTELGLDAEADCCHACGIEFVSVPVMDLGVPADGAAFRACAGETAEALQRGISVAVHCRQSIGRSGLFTCSVLIALGSGVDEAIHTVSTARGVSVPETAEQKRWLADHAARLARVGSVSDRVD